MDNVKRIGNIAKKAIYTTCNFILALSARAKPYDKRKYNSDADNLIQAIDTYRFIISQIRHREYHNQQRAANPKCAFHAPCAKLSSQQHTHRKWEEHTHCATPEIHRIDSPAHTDTIISRQISHKEIGVQNAKNSRQRSQCLGRKMAANKRLKNIANVLKKERPHRAI